MRLRNRVAELVEAKARRTGHHITKMDIVRETGLAPLTVAKWFANDVSRKDDDTIFVWCKYLDCNWTELFVVEDDEPQKQSLLTHPTADFSVVAMSQ